MPKAPLRPRKGNEPHVTEWQRLARVGQKISANTHLYRRPVEVNFYAGDIPRGLSPIEQWAAKTYFPKGGTVLDIGCGAGREAFSLSSMGFRVTGLDCSAPMIIKARKEAQQRKQPVRFVQGTFPALRMPERMFDVVFLPGIVIGHIQPREDRVLALQKAVRLAKTDGLIVVEFRNWDKDLDAKETRVKLKREFEELRKKNPHAEFGDKRSLKSSKRVTEKAEKPMVFHHHTSREAESELRAAGLRVVDKKISKITQDKQEAYVMYVCMPRQK